MQKSYLQIFINILENQSKIFNQDKNGIDFEISTSTNPTKK